MALPGLVELAGIVYASSSGMRRSSDWRELAQQGERTSSPVVYIHRLAIATINVNRARQNMSIGQGITQGGSTERPAFPPRSRLALPGVEEEWKECQSAAKEALRTAVHPLRLLILWEGAQFYEHRWGPAPRRVRPGPMGRFAQLLESIGPMWDPRPNKGQVWLDIHVDRISRDAF